MTQLLTADFARQFPRGPTISASFQRPAKGFSVTALMGPSGCGKTTVLRCLAGLDCPVRGTIQFADDVWFHAERRVFKPPQARGVSFVFQEYALFPHLTVEKNIGYPLPRLGRDARRRTIANVLDRVQLRGLEHRYPNQLSGGQQQRLALARAIVRKPKLLLFDEPFSSLDGPTRDELRLELRRVLDSFGIPVFVVTHDIIDALNLADYVIILHNGTVRQQGVIEEVFSRPVDDVVARIVGIETVVRGRVLRAQDGLLTVSIGNVEVFVVGDAPIDGEVDLCIRAQDVVLVDESTPMGSVRNKLRGRVTAVAREGPLARIVLDCGFRLTALVTHRACEDLKLLTGTVVFAGFKATAVHLIRRNVSGRESHDQR